VLWANKVGSQKRRSRSGKGSPRNQALPALFVHEGETHHPPEERPFTASETPVTPILFNTSRSPSNISYSLKIVESSQDTRLRSAPGPTSTLGFLSYPRIAVADPDNDNPSRTSNTLPCLCSPPFILFKASPKSPFCVAIGLAL
jgi:hypothetical protein